MLADVSDGRVEILPKRLNACLVFAFVLFFVSQTDLVSFIVNVRRELLLVQVVDDAVNGLVFAGWVGLRSCPST